MMGDSPLRKSRTIQFEYRTKLKKMRVLCRYLQRRLKKKILRRQNIAPSHGYPKNIFQKSQTILYLNLPYFGYYIIL